jgi:hypothetical protein
VENHARVPQGELARVEREAARVYEAAGVRVVWVHGDDEADTNDAGGKPLRVLLLGRNMTNRKAAIEDIGPAVLGRASRITGRAYVFVQRVIDLALASGKSSELMLSRVMAHEIGHLLLQEGSHSRTGIMRERLSMRLYQDELFTEPQAREIQLALNR